MRCSKVEDMLPLFAGGELQDSRQREVEEHLTRCDKCRRVLSQYENLLEASRSVPPVELPDAVQQSLIQEIMDRSREMQGAEPSHHHRNSSKQRFPFRYRLVGATAVTAVALIAVVIAISTHFIGGTHGPGLEYYLLRSDLKGLSEALKNDESRNRLLDESVSVDLLIQTVEQIQKPRTLHRHVEQHIARSLQAIKADLPAGFARQTSRGSQTARSLAACADIGDERVRLETILHTLRCLRRSGDRISLREILQGLGIEKETKEAMG
jgi:hypothetical protein